MIFLKKLITLSLFAISINNLTAQEETIDYEYLSKKEVTKACLCDLKTERALVQDNNQQNLDLYIKGWQIAMGKTLHFLIKRAIQLKENPNSYIKCRDSNISRDDKENFKNRMINKSHVEDKINGGFFEIPESVLENVESIKNGDVDVISVIFESKDDFFNTLIYNIYRDLLIRYFFVKQNYCALSHLIVQPSSFMPSGLWDFYNNRTSNNSELLDTEGLFKDNKFQQQGAPQYSPYDFSSNVNLELFQNHIAKIERVKKKSIINLGVCISKAKVASVTLPSKNHKIELHDSHKKKDLAKDIKAYNWPHYKTIQQFINGLEAIKYYGTVDNALAASKDLCDLLEPEITNKDHRQEKKKSLFKWGNS